ncbi:MAG TPA: glycosyltransferase family 39 protein [Solirubrobacteraceae bacterium]|nr:glycosyltransferase family 39 protein [Solirubrobacteraceae bacterium]
MRREHQGDAGRLRVPPRPPAGEAAGRDLPGRARARLAALGEQMAPLRRLLADPMAPIVALCVILVLSFAARMIDYNEPCSSPCKTPASHTLIFDEAYYVNAAKVIDHINPGSGENYHNAPLGKDPNAEHPQLAKLIIAGAIELFGDGPFAWRIGSMLFSLIALCALYALVRGLGGSGWLAVGTVGVASLDNLFLVSSRVGTLDIYALTLMLIAMALYVRRRPLLAGIALGVGMCMKEVAVYLLAVIVVYELLALIRRWWQTGSLQGFLREYVRPVAIAIGGTAVTFLLLLLLLDVLVPAYDTGTHIEYAGNPFAHFFHMIHYATLLKAEPSKPGISSSPWEWLLNEKVIPYAKTVVTTKANGHVVGLHPIYLFLGEINPFIIFLAIPALFCCLACWWRSGDRVCLLGVAWFLGTFLPSVLESEVYDRVNYIYYMLIVVPAIYVMLARVFGDRRVPRAALVGWVIMLAFGFGDLYPIRTLL